jgi:hypothetical protein
LKKDETLWIKLTHTNTVFYRPTNGKTNPLTKDIEQELKDGDEIGLLPTSFFFRVSFSTDMNENKDQVCFRIINILFFIDLISRMSLNQLIQTQNDVNYQHGCQHQQP